MRAYFLSLTCLLGTLACAQTAPPPPPVSESVEIRLKSLDAELDAFKAEMLALRWEQIGNREEGVQIGFLNGVIRQIAEETRSGASYRYVYRPDGTPFFTFAFESGEEWKYYFEWAGGAALPTVIRVIGPDGREKTDLPTYTDKLADSYRQYHYCVNSLNHSPAVYDSINDLIAERQRAFNNLDLTIIDTVVHHQPRVFHPAPGSNEPAFDPCRDFTVRYGLAGKFPVLRSYRTHGCDGGHVAHTENEVITEMNASGDTLRMVTRIINHSLSSDSPIKQLFDVQQTTSYWLDRRRAYVRREHTLNGLPLKDNFITLQR